MTMYSQRVAEQLIQEYEETKANLLERGYCKFALTDAQGRACLVGAMPHTCSLEEPHDVLALLASARGYGDAWLTSPTGMRLYYGLPCAHIHFNNAPETTMNDMIDLLDEAILYVKEHTDDGRNERES